MFLAASFISDLSIFFSFGCYLCCCICHYIFSHFIWFTCMPVFGILCPLCCRLTMLYLLPSSVLLFLFHFMLLLFSICLFLVALLFHGSGFWVIVCVRRVFRQPFLFLSHLLLLFSYYCIVLFVADRRLALGLYLWFRISLCILRIFLLTYAIHCFELLLLIYLSIYRSAIHIFICNLILFFHWFILSYPSFLRLDFIVFLFLVLYLWLYFFGIGWIFLSFVLVTVILLVLLLACSSDVFISVYFLGK